jgi:hypothetical protein
MMSSKEQMHSTDIANSKQQTKSFTETLNILAQPQSHPATIIQRATLDPHLLAPRDMLQLQRLIGNQAAGQLTAKVVQRRLEGEQQVEHFKRKMITAYHINEVAASGTLDPSHVRLLVFSGREGLIANVSPIRTNQRPRDQNPHTPVSEIRAGIVPGSEARVARHASRDAEMFQLDELRDITTRFVATRPGFHSGYSDELRIEMIGPRGTCEDCAAALGAAIQAWQVLFNETFGPGVLKLSLMTRWTGPQRETGQRVGSGRDQSTVYGTTDAAFSLGPKVGPGEYIPAEHHKLRIR